MKNRVTDFLSYRWRYVLGYGFIVVVMGIMLVVAALYVPHELRQAEIDSALTSGSLGTASMAPSAVIDLPYHLLQKLSFIVFGVTVLSIKLPSILLGALTALGIFLLVRTWFKANVAVLATLLTVVTAQFLFMSQDGTPGIMYAFLSIWLLFVATFVTRRKYFGLFWKVLTCIAMAMSLYTPTGVYLVAVMLITALFHPHIRFLIRRFNKLRVALALLLGAGAIVPLLYAIMVDHSIGTALLGIPNGPVNLVSNAGQVLKDAFGFASQSASYLVRPLYPIGVAILMFVGLFRILTHRYSARSYITLAWGLITIVMVIINPKLVTNLFPIAVILISYGMIYMVYSWYRIFPRNPYARVAGMVPLVVFVLAMVVSGVTRFISTYHYNPVVLSGYSSDVTLLRTTLATQHAQAGNTQVVVSPPELPFYRLIAKYDKRFTAEGQAAAGKAITIYSHAATRPATPPSTITVSQRAQQADRFYIYK